MTGELPHPVTGQPFPSPVRPGTGWPGDLATTSTPVARDAHDVAELAGAADLAELDARVSVCRACPRLVQWREQVAGEKRASFADQPYWGRPAPGFGDPNPRLLIVGLAPAAHGANRTGRMFTGDRSGDWLYAALHRAGLASQPDSRAAGDGLRLNGVRIVAAVRCAPPGNKPITAEAACCQPWLRREFELGTGVEAILALGGIGWQACLRTARQIGWRWTGLSPRFGHGQQVMLTTTQPGRSVRLVASYHVSQQNTFTGRLTENMLDAVIAAVA